MLKVLLISNNILAEPIVRELESLGHEVTHLDSVDFAKEHIFYGDFDIILLDYKESQKLSDDEVYEIRFFSHIPYELPIFLLIDKESHKVDFRKKILYNGVFPYNHSLNMINEFIAHFQPLRSD